eukprot:CAMPEP_0174285592 /NCGR_PEP_ID=MMETSP0809-20121228/8956_1 /TAXON_ID=73025 ORGANISM="Eutreptiella gymnastica-like, Strain CCMP1594" /NCGR_SAMPLE_ID=MMETSP0809 /ASSEMBLY_ACC=CAM_ASM_000658 /LENGTH=143 /DNA_ID=CAMNT_0015381401 /DNA_START=239 /DNA_END=667 /DNA_ORIENTATION=-
MHPDPLNTSFCYSGAAAALQHTAVQPQGSAGGRRGAAPTGGRGDASHVPAPHRWQPLRRGGPAGRRGCPAAGAFVATGTLRRNALRREGLPPLLRGLLASVLRLGEQVLTNQGPRGMKGGKWKVLCCADSRISERPVPVRTPP